MVMPIFLAMLKFQVLQKFFGNAEVYDNAKLHHGPKVYDNAKVFGNAILLHNPQVYGNAQVYRKTPELIHEPKVYDNAMIFWLRKSCS